MKLLIALLITIVSLSAKEITLKSADGFVMHGWLDYPKEKKESYPLVFFAHQFGADHTIWNDLAADLRTKGYATLNIDLRGHGKSTMQNGKENSIINDVNMDHIGEAIKQSREKVKFEKIPSDISAWLDHAGEIETLDMGGLILFGSSLGAGSLIPILPDYEAKAAVLLSPGSGKEEVLKEALGFSETPILFIAGKNDPLKAQERALKYSHYALKGTYIMISSGGHGTVLLPWVTDYIFTFLNK